MKLEQITFTRFIAALTVVFFHYGGEVCPFFEPIIKAGPIAVSYFYALSGFIMAIAYYHPKKNTGFSYKKYWVARFARIYPIYCLALLMVVFSRHENFPDIIQPLLLNLTMLQTWIPQYSLSLNSPGWSLSVEMFFYLSFPFLLFLIQRYAFKTLLTISLLFWVFSQCLHTYILNSPTYQPFSNLHNFIYYNPLMHWNVFILGVLVGVYYKKNSTTLTIKYQNSYLILSILTISILLIYRSEISNLLNIKIDYTDGLIAPIFLIFIVLLAYNKGKITTILQNKNLVLLGNASFSLYILQQPVHGIYNELFTTKFPLPENVHFYLFLLILIIISVLSHLWIETPARKFINSRYPLSVKTG